MKRFFSIFIIIIFSLSLGGCRVPFTSKEITVPFFEKQPQDAFKLSLEALENMETYSYSSNLNISFKFLSELGFLKEETKENLLAMINNGSPKVLGIDNVTQEEMDSPLPMLKSFPENIKISYKIKGRVDQKDRNNIKNNINIQASIDLGGVSFEVELNVIILGEVLYIEFVTIPFFLDSLLGDMEIDLSSTWWKIDSSASEKYVEEFSTGFNIPITDGLGDTEKTRETKQKIEEIFKKYPILEIEERLLDVKIDDQKHYHYKSGLNVENLKKALIEILQISDEEFKIEDTLGNAQKEEFGEKVDELENILTKKDVEFWINKKTYDLRKTIFDLEIDTSKTKTSSESDMNGIIGIKGSMDYFNINNKVVIEEPENYIDFFELIFKRIEEARLKARDAKRLADARQIQTALELYYNDNGFYPEELNSLMQTELLDVENEEAFNFNPAYLFSLPVDPKPNNECGDEFEIEYSSLENNQNYRLIVCFEEQIGTHPKGRNNLGSMISDATRAEVLNEAPIQGAMLDSDNDGLNDFEEEMVYFTDANNPDTDGDGYKDGDEVKNGYNPKGSGKITEINLVNWIEYKDDKISIKYPSNWQKIDDWSENFSDRQVERAGLNIQFLSPLENDNDNFFENVLLAVTDLSSMAKSMGRDLKTEDWTNEYGDESDQTLVETKDITLAGYSAKREVIDVDVYLDYEVIPTRYVSYYFIKDNYLYFVQYGTDNLTETYLNDNYYKIAEEMVKSFKLIEE